MTEEEQIKQDLLHVGKLVESARKASGLSVAAFAKKAELTPVTVYSLEAGKAKFHSKTAQKLLQAMELTEEDAALIARVGSTVNRHTKPRKQKDDAGTPSTGEQAAADTSADTES